MTPDIEYLLSLEAVRERAQIVFAAAKRDELSYFTYHADKLPEAAAFVTSVINRDFGPDNFEAIPPHGRWQHFNVGGVPRIDDLNLQWKNNGQDRKEQARRLIDLFVVSVLLDAGAGDKWKFEEPDSSGQVYTRSEGIAVASLYMFLEGKFSTTEGVGHMVDGECCYEGGTRKKLMCVTAKGLQRIDEETLAKGFQITAENPMIGVGSRAQLLSRLGDSLLQHSDIFGPDGRPGNLVDYVIKTSDSDSKELDYRVFWMTLQKLLIPIWPKDRTQIDGTPIGDAWPLKVLEKQNDVGKDIKKNIQPFHKLTQWLAYSLMVPFVNIMGYSWRNAELGTGLPEYRNGGLFVDLGVLTLKPEALERGQRASGQELPMFKDSGDEIVEWRALTVALLDEVYGIIKKDMDGQGVEFSMAQMLEAGSWKSGRELAAKKRPETKSSPILIDGDGTLF
ncbi:DUF1688-domain-containing protein [Aureobasidium sp. EXF-8845]|nr:DUF1688-domain-containing protein [Aureobasidium sp. EXF-8845]KAI4854713.1 DUF1688-domain-containing protein [Aureobasidium sp. EXF-8846]